jgi:hypothetical protein
LQCGRITKAINNTLTTIKKDVDDYCKGIAGRFLFGGDMVEVTGEWLDDVRQGVEELR